LIAWLTGLPCAGKTTIGEALVDSLRSQGAIAELLDGDAIRRKYWPELGYSREDREQNIRRIGEFAGDISKTGTIAVVSVVSPYRAVRDAIRAKHPAFIEVYVNAPLAVCEERDVKGMYAKARAGNLPNFTGVDDPYEPPLAAEVECRTDLETVQESVDKILVAISEALEEIILQTEKETA
jgi:adenylylsulfate kinase